MVTRFFRCSICAVLVGALLVATPVIGQTIRKLEADDGLPPIYLRGKSDFYSEVRAGILAGFEEDNAVYTVEMNGAADVIPLDIEGGVFRLLSAAVGADRTVAVCGWGFDPEGRRSTFVARISPDRKTTVVTRIWPYVAEQLAVAGDGTIWTVGWKGQDPPTTINVLERIDGSNKVASASQIRARATPGHEGMGDAVDGSRIKASSDRVAWLTGGNEYIEFSLDGRERFRIDGPPLAPDTFSLLTFAMRNDGAVVVGVNTRWGSRADASPKPNASRKWTWELWSLDRDAGDWIRIEIIGKKLPVQGIVLGFDGDDLVTAENRRLYRYKPVSDSPAQ